MPTRSEAGRTGTTGTTGETGPGATNAQAQADFVADAVEVQADRARDVFDDAQLRDGVSAEDE